MDVEPSFFDFGDKENEPWAQSEKLVRDTYPQKLDIELDDLAIERAHRIGTFLPDKKPPIILKLFFFLKRKQQTLLFSS